MTTFVLFLMTTNNDHFCFSLSNSFRYKISAFFIDKQWILFINQNVSSCNLKSKIMVFIALVFLGNSNNVIVKETQN